MTRQGQQQLAEVNLQPSGKALSICLPQGCPTLNSQKTPLCISQSEDWTVSESEATARTSSSCTLCLPRMLRLRNDSVIRHHHSYFQVCKWCAWPALMQKLTPVSFCKRFSCNRAPFPIEASPNYKAWFSRRSAWPDDFLILLLG